MNAKHTPGPWHVKRSGNLGGKAIVALVTAMETDTTCVLVARIAPVVVSYGGDDIANAHLIVAAPDLLAACKELVDYRRRVGPLNFQLEKADDYIRMIEKAIAAATSPVAAAFQFQET